MAAVVRRHKTALLTVGLLTLSLGFYIYSLSPSIGWEDAPKFPRHAYLLRLSALPWDHPLYTFVGYLFTKIPISDVAYRVNLVSAVFGSLTVVVVFSLLLLLFSAGNLDAKVRSPSLDAAPFTGGSPVRGPELVAAGGRLSAAAKVPRSNVDLLAALGGALSLMVSRTFWLHSVTTEVYIVLGFFTMAMLYCLVRFDLLGDKRFLYFGFFLYGLSFAVHPQTVFALPGLLVYLIILVFRRKGRLDFRSAGLAGLSLLVGLLPYLALGLKDILYLQDRYRMPLSMVINNMTGGGFKNSFMNATASVSSSLVQAAGYHFYDFMALGTLLGLFGLFLWLVRDSRRFAYVFAMYAGHLTFAVLYFVTDQNTFYLPALAIFSLFVGYGLWGLLRTSKTRRKTALVGLPVVALLWLAPVTVYSALPSYIEGLDPTARRVWEDTVIAAYGRRGDWELQAVWQRQGKAALVKHYLNPNQRDDQIPRQYGEAILDSLPTGSVFVTGSLWDWYAFAVIDYLRDVENRRPDVEFVHWEFPWEQPFSEWAFRNAIVANVGRRPVFISVPCRYGIGNRLPGYRFVPHGLVYQVVR